MLVLSRGIGDAIDIELEDGRRITVVLMDMRPGRARIGIKAPPSVRILRHELIIQAERGRRDAKD